jgi:hypothetical protein
MTREQARRYHYLCQTLNKYGIDPDGVDILLRAERTLHRWAEMQCNGDVEYDDDGLPCNRYGQRVSDREAGALKRIAATLKDTGLTARVQGDPRGCSLYLIRADDRTNSVWHGIAVCL